MGIIQSDKKIVDKDVQYKPDKKSEKRSAKSNQSNTENKLGTLLINALIIFGPILVYGIYFKLKFVGFINPDALDYAQIGRNVSAGHGFTTYILRPLALTHGNNPLNQPDVTHGPLFTFLLALAYGIFGAKDSVSAIVSGIFYWLSSLSIYYLGRQIFNKNIGLICSLMFMLNAYALEYAISGLPITLTILLMSCILICLHTIANTVTRNKPTKSALAMLGVFNGLLYLSDPVYAWLAPVTIIALIIILGKKNILSLSAYLLPLIVITIPWLIRNGMITGNPVYGLQGVELWMNTRNHYPGFYGYRLAPGSLILGQDLFKDIVAKIFYGFGQVIETFPQIMLSWVLAFFLPSIFFKFADYPTNISRSTLIGYMGALIISSVVFSLQLTTFVALIPGFLVYSVAYLVYIISAANIKKGSLYLTVFIISVLLSYPLFNTLLLSDKPAVFKEARTAKHLADMSGSTDVVLSDQPWIPAWYANRPSILIPASDTHIMDLRNQFTGLKWLFLTDSVNNYSPQWQYLFGSFKNWDQLALKQTQQVNSNKQPAALVINGNTQVPLFNSLQGFTSVLPRDSYAGDAVVATLPEQKNR